MEEPVSPWHFTRFALYTKLLNILASHDGPNRKCLSISNSKVLVKVLGLKKTQITNTVYPELDFLKMPFEDGAFDFCVSDMVLEHVAGNPFDAVRESLRVVRPGGFIVHTTALMHAIHAEPDYWRFTPDGLKVLCENVGGKVISVDGWGSMQAFDLIRQGFRFTKVPLDPKHPTHRIAIASERLNPITTWLVAQKP
jgi:SAM-dependent methyltransferase